MAPTRKAKGVMRYATVNEASAEKYGGGSNKKKQRRKLSDKLGLQWSNGELQRFYDAYRKYGKDWRKVAAAVRSRSIEMVEALYNMNRAYLSLPEGTASVVGLTAMMTDHYNVMEGSDSERESNDGLGSRKPQKRKLGKDQPSVSKDVLHTHPSASLEGCLSLLKRRKLDGDQPRAVGKRTPQVTISYPHKKDDREAYVSPIKKGRKSEGDNDDDIAHVAALLTEASQRGSSPQVSQTPYGRPVHIKSSSVQSSGRMHPPPGKARANLHRASVDEDWLEGSLGSGGAETGDDAGHLLEGVGTVEMSSKLNKLYKKREKVKHSGNHQFDDGWEACSRTEGLNVSSRAIDDSEVSNIKGERPSPIGQRKESKKLYFGVTNQPNQISTPSKQWKSARSLEGSLNSDHRRTVSDLTGSTAQASTSSQVNLPMKRTSRLKMYIPRTWHPKEKYCEKKLKNQLSTRSNSVQDRALHLKEKISCCLSSHLVRRWCTFEWFYSALDYPWFAKREFEEYLNHVGLGHIPRLTRVEWGVIRSSLGKPRMFSEHFLHEEREKLKQYRESVRKHYAELRTGVREGLPTDLARPLSVGQRVIALHPKTREVHDGSVLTVDHDKCRVQFDRPDIGVEFVMDVDCMPLNPLDNMPEALRRQNISFDKSFLTSKEPNKNGNLNFGGPMMFHSSGYLVKATSAVNAYIKQGKVRDELERRILPSFMASPRPSNESGSTFGGSGLQLRFINKLPTTIFTGSRVEAENGEPDDSVYKKHHPPHPNDEIWRLEKISKDGAFHKRLYEKGISTVEDFLQSYMKDASSLRNFLHGISNKIWDTIVEHAKACKLDDHKFYAYHRAEQDVISLIFNSIHGLVGAIINGEFCSLDGLDSHQKMRVEALKQQAYRNVRDLVPIDASTIFGLSKLLPVPQADSFACPNPDMQQVEFQLTHQVYKKHHPPHPNDEIWRLEKISKDGAFHKRLYEKGISTVEDFLQSYMKDASSLRNVLRGISNKIWDTIVEHAMACKLDDRKFYAYHRAEQDVSLMFNSIHGLERAIINGQFCSLDELDANQKMLVEALKQQAYRNVRDLVPVDASTMFGLSKPLPVLQADSFTCPNPDLRQSEFQLTHQDGLPIQAEGSSNQLMVSVAQPSNPIQLRSSSISMEDLSSIIYSGESSWPPVDGFQAPIVPTGHLGTECKT